MSNIIREQVYAKNRQSKKEKVQQRDAAAAAAAASAASAAEAGPSSASSDAETAVVAAGGITDLDLAAMDDRRLLEELARRARTRRLGGS